MASASSSSTAQTPSWARHAIRVLGTTALAAGKPVLQIMCWVDSLQGTEGRGVTNYVLHTSVAGVLVAALPSIVSTRIGLAASLAALNMLTPGMTLGKSCSLSPLHAGS